jgi:hypothetical protein
MLSLASVFQARIAASIVVAAGGNLSWKEKFFVSFAWFPKATVQVSFVSSHIETHTVLDMEAKSFLRTYVEACPLCIIFNRLRRQYKLRTVQICTKEI